MAAITFNYTGNELIQARAENPSPLAPIESGARVRVKKFSFTAAEDVANASQVELLEFPNRVSILGGAITKAQIGAASVDLGWTLKSAPDDANSDAFVLGANAPVAFAPVLVTTTGVTSLFLENSDTIASGSVVEGYVLYVENS